MILIAIFSVVVLLSVLAVMTFIKLDKELREKIEASNAEGRRRLMVSLCKGLIDPYTYNQLIKAYY